MSRYFSSCYLLQGYTIADMGETGDSFVSPLQFGTHGHGLVPRFFGQQKLLRIFQALVIQSNMAQRLVSNQNSLCKLLLLKLRVHSYLLIERGSFYRSLRHHWSYQRQLPVNQEINEMSCDENINKITSQHVLYV